MKDFLLNNWGWIVAALPTAFIVFRVVAKHTPTKIDDEIVEIVEEVKDELGKGDKK